MELIIQSIVEIVKNLPGPVATMIIGTMPLAESRVAVPLAITYFKIHPVLAILYSALGDLIPVIFLINFLGPVAGFLSRHSKLAEKFFHWLFRHTRHKFTGKYEKWGILGLVLFVAIPIPGSGSWAGSAAAFLFGIPKNKAFAAIALGVIIAGSIVATVTLGIGEILSWFY